MENIEVTAELKALFKDVYHLRKGKQLALGDEINNKMKADAHNEEAKQAMMGLFGAQAEDGAIKSVEKYKAFRKSVQDAARAKYGAVVETTDDEEEKGFALMCAVDASHDGITLMDMAKAMKTFKVLHDEDK